MPKKSESKVVEAVGTAASQSNNTPSAKDIEAAMAQAAEQAQAEGVSDPDEIRSRMLEARKRVTQANG
jgi:hypothetical protein